jgi:hypothetical protein
MLCELLTNNPEQQLPEHISELYSQYVHKLFTGRIHTNAERKTSRDIIKLFEKIAAERQFRDPELPILAAMTSCVQGTLLESESADPDIRDRDLYDRLCRTGLVVSAIGGVEFAHATLEEYFAARHVVYRLTNLSNANQQHTVNQIVNAFSAHHRASEFFGISQLPVFLIDMWATMGNDTDSLLTHLVRSSPEDSWLLVRRLWKAGMAIGSKSTAELATVTDATVMDSDDQRGMAITLRSLGHPEGIARLLGMAVDMDLPDAVRITTIKDASGSSVAAAAAVSFLVMRHDFPDWEFPYSAMDAIDATPEVADDAILEGLMLIIQNKHIAEGARLHAAAIAFMNEGESIYRRLLNEWFPTSLTTLLAEEVVRGTTEAWSVLWRMVTDADLAPDRRFDAADELVLQPQGVVLESLSLVVAPPGSGLVESAPVRPVIGVGVGMNRSGLDSPQTSNLVAG